MADEQEPGAEPTMDDLLDAIRGIRVSQFLLSTASTLASLAYGKLDAGDLDEARAAIDALRALLPVVEEQLEPDAARDLRTALANLQVAYSGAVSGGPSASPS